MTALIIRTLQAGRVRVLPVGTMYIEGRFLEGLGFHSKYLSFEFYSD